MSNSRYFWIAAVSLIAVAPIAVEGQSSVTVSPFVSLVPSSNANPLAGIALTFGGTTGLALRGSADMSIANPNKLDSASSSPYRPWATDADGMLFLGGLGGGATVFSRSLSPYVFSGIGITGGDSAGKYVVQNGWSYGVGAAIPLGLDADLFAEARWRMNQYVLPTAKDAPDSKSELRFGLSFHVGGGGRSNEPAPRRRGRHRMDVYDDEEEPVAVYPTYPAPAPTATATATAINVNVATGSTGSRSSSGRRYEPSVLPSTTRQPTWSVRAPRDVRRVVQVRRRGAAAVRASTKARASVSAKARASVKTAASKVSRRRNQDRQK